MSVVLVDQLYWFQCSNRGSDSPNQYFVISQTSMNATMQMDAVNTVVLTPLGASSAAVTQGTSWMEMD